MHSKTFRHPKNHPKKTGVILLPSAGGCMCEVQRAMTTAWLFPVNKMWHVWMPHCITDYWVYCGWRTWYLCLCGCWMLPLNEESREESLLYDSEGPTPKADVYCWCFWHLNKFLLPSCTVAGLEISQCVVTLSTFDQITKVIRKTKTSTWAQEFKVHCQWLCVCCTKTGERMHLSFIVHGVKLTSDHLWKWYGWWIYT